MRCVVRQRGAAALELALVLPVLLLMIYGIIVYSYMFVLQEAITFAAQESAEAAVKVDPALTAGAYSTTVASEVRARAVSVLSFLPVAQQTRVLGVNGAKVQVTVGPSPTGIGGVVTVNMVFDFTGLFPVITLPGLGAIPPVPAVLHAIGVVGV